MFTSNRKQRVNAMQCLSGGNLFIHINLGHDVFELSIAEHANVNVLNGKNLFAWEKRQIKMLSLDLTHGIVQVHRRQEKTSNPLKDISMAAD